MKVLVCHPGKQHVNALLTALDRRGALAHFCTMLAANRVSGLRFFPKKIRSQFLKFFFKEVDGRKIAHFPALFFLLKLTKTEYWSIRLTYDLFDRWAARRSARVDFDIVVGYETTTLALFAAAKKAGKTTVLDLAGTYHHFEGPILRAAGLGPDGPATEFISKKKDDALALTDHVITLSKQGERALIGAGFAPERIHRVSLGADQSVFSPKKGYRTDTGGPLNLYYVGNLSLRKGMVFMAGLVNDLRGRGLDVRLTCIGAAGDFDPAAHGLEPGFFRHIPFVAHAELAALHHQLDLFLFPSYMDSWGMSVVEAMASGSPVIVSAHTGSQDAVEQGGGFVLPMGDHVAWLAAIERFYHDRSLLKKIGEEAARVAKNYTWEAYQEQVFGALERIYSTPSN